MNVLSLFDGMSCGQIALNELGMPIDNYYASEIDKHAIMQTQLNFPNTKQLGSVVDVDVRDLERIDLLIGGSPCQSFSFAGKRKGMSTKCEEEILTLERYLELKAEGFEFEGQSYLFWEFMRILTDIRKTNPGVLFLLENVEMGKKWERVLSEAIGVFGVHINSALVSAQNRKRIYWTNIRTRPEGLFGDFYSDIPQPEDRGLLLRDVLEDDVDEKYYLSEKATKGVLNHKEEQMEKGNGFGVVMRTGDDKMGALSVGGKGVSDVIQIPEATTKGYVEINPGECVDLENMGSKTRRGRKMEDKSNSLMAQNMQFHQYTKDFKLRRLTPTECSRLQTIPAWYKWECSDTQQYRMLGNGWTVEVIKHIFSFI